MAVFIFICLQRDVPWRSAWSCLTSSSPRQRRTSSDIKDVGGEWVETEEEEEEEVEEEEDGCQFLYKGYLVL